MTRGERTFRELIPDDISPWTETDESSEERWREVARRVRLIVRTSVRGLPPVETEDLTQTILLRLATNSRLREAVRAAEMPNVYISRLARNAAIDIVRSRSRRVERLDRAAEQIPAMNVDRERRAQQLEAALRTLTEEELHLLQSRFWDGKGLRQIAEEIGLSISGTAKRLFKTIAKLRMLLDLYS